jgi:hypothetical protein
LLAVKIQWLTNTHDGLNFRERLGNQASSFVSIHIFWKRLIFIHNLGDLHLTSLCQLLDRHSVYGKNS